MMKTADAASRPWQFSIRGLLVLTFVASILFTLISRYGYHGFLAFVSLMAIALLLAGIVLNRNQYIAWGLLFLFASFGKTGILIIMIASGLYVLTGAMILASEWLVRCVSKVFGRS